MWESEGSREEKLRSKYIIPFVTGISNCSVHLHMGILECLSLGKIGNLSKPKNAVYLFRKPDLYAHVLQFLATCCYVQYDFNARHPLSYISFISFLRFIRRVPIASIYHRHIHARIEGNQTNFCIAHTPTLHTQILRVDLFPHFRKNDLHTRA